MSYIKMLSKIEEKLEEIATPDRPTTFGNTYFFPEDLTRLSSEQVGELMGRLGAYRGYAARLLCLSEIRQAAYEEEFKETMVRLVGEMDDGKRSRTELKETASLDKGVLEIKESVFQYRSYSRAYHSLVDIYDNQIMILSRELSRRQMTRGE